MSEQGGSQGPPDISGYMPGQEVTGSDPNTGQGEASLSDDFLSHVPEADRAVVGRYIKDWDSGVTKRFQEIHNQYAPYKELGDVEQLRQAIEVYDLLDNSPEVVYETLKQHFQDNVAPQNYQGYNQQNQQLPAPPQPPPELQQALNPFIQPLQDKLQEQQEMMEKMAQVILQGNQSQQEAAEDHALDQYLAELEERHGKFDQRAILMSLYEGKDGDQAVKEWRESLSQWAPQPQTQVPPPLFGGSTPSDNVDIGAMSDKDVKALTANVFAALQNNQ
jgi:hypothetical protein